MREANEPEIVEDFPVTAMQEGMVYHSRRGGDSSLYFQQYVLKLPADLDLEVLRQAWEDVVRWTPALRTAFAWSEDGELSQRTVRGVSPRWEVHDLDLSADQDSDWSERLDAFLRRDRDEGFDLSRAPLTRFHILRSASFRVLVWSFHHTVLDGWSTGLVMQDLESAFKAREHARQASDPCRPSFSDFCLRNWAIPPQVDRAWWRRRLSGAAEFVAKDWHEGDRTAETRCTLRDLERPSEVLGGAAARKGVTPAVVCHAAWALTVRRYSGARGVRFGTVLSGRTERDAAFVGMSVNSLPLATDIDPRLSLASWLEELSGSLMDLQERSTTSLSDLRKLCEGPLFDTLVVVENYPSAAPPLGMEMLRGHERTNYPVVLVVFMQTGRVELHHDPTLVSSSLADDMLADFVGSLDRLADPRATTINDVCLPPRRGSQAIGPRPVEGPELLGERFAGHCERNPGAVAVETAERSVTYAELAAITRRIAGGLVSEGVRRGDIVALLLPRQVELIACMLACVQIGAVYMPISASSPPARVDSVMRTSGAKLAVVAGGGRQVTQGRSILLRDLLEAEPERARVEALESELLYVMCTSGSSGTPKPAAVSHGGIANLFGALVSEFGEQLYRRTAASNEHTWDASVPDLLGPIYTGGTIVMLDNPLSPGPSTGISSRILPVGAIEAMLASGRGGEFPRMLITGGETPPDALVADLGAELPEIALINVYGPTEATVLVSWDECAPGEEVTIGRPIDGVRMYVLDEDLELVPREVPGRLFLAGPCVGQGYLGMPRATALAFRPDPFATEPGERMYDTGDTVVQRADGRFVFRGRSDRQVKLRGYRIELREVESAFTGVEGVEECVAVIQGRGAAAKLVLFYTGTAALDTLRERSGGLPSYMRPAIIEGLDGLPRTSNGKIDMRSLTTMKLEEALEAGNMTPPEREMAAIWEDVLDAGQVSENSDFFELGGNSLLAVRLSVMIESRLSRRCAIDQIFDTPRLRDLVGELARPSAESQ